jgi:hypothetical protein
MGVGSCCYLMAPLALYAKRYPPQQFGTLVGFQLGVGTLERCLHRAACLVGVLHRLARDHSSRSPA